MNEATAGSPTTHAEDVRQLYTMLMDAKWMPSEIDAMEFWEVAHLCSDGDGVLHGEALALANQAAREGRGPKPVAPGIQRDSLVGFARVEAPT